MSLQPDNQKQVDFRIRGFRHALQEDCYNRWVNIEVVMSLTSVTGQGLVSSETTTETLLGKQWNL